MNKQKYKNVNFWIHIYVHTAKIWIFISNFLIMRLIRFFLLYLKVVFCLKKFICEHSQDCQIFFWPKKHDIFRQNFKFLYELGDDIVNIFAFVQSDQYNRVAYEFPRIIINHFESLQFYGKVLGLFIYRKGDRFDW